MSRHPELLKSEQAGLLVIDIQEKILKVMNQPERVIENSVKLISGFHILKRPVFATEQNPEGIGQTVKPVKKALGDLEFSLKETFSCCGIEGFVRSLRSRKIQQIVLCGIESHVCVWQTAMDLRKADFQVTVVSDAVSSRQESDYQTALNLMRTKGIDIRSTEMVLFEMLEKIGTDSFKEILALIK